MALFHLDDDQLQDFLLTPPLKTVSVCSSTSTTVDDSSSTVSSLDADDVENCWGDESPIQSQNQTTARRCIFASYWKVKGGRPKEPLRGSRGDSPDVLPDTVSQKSHENNWSLSSPQSPQDESIIDTSSYEDILEDSASSLSIRRPAAEALLLGDDSATSLGSSCRRRSLWGGDNRYTQSAPSLPQCVDLPREECFRKTQSSRGINERRPSSSCLKSCRRYSGEMTAGAPRRSSKATVVSFCEDVQVKFVPKTDVVFAEKGWSKYFM